MPIDKRDPEKAFYHIITKKDKAQFKLPENVTLILKLKLLIYENHFIDLHLQFGVTIPDKTYSRVGDAKMKRASKNKVVETALFMDKVSKMIK